MSEHTYELDAIEIFYRLRHNDPTFKEDGAGERELPFLQQLSQAIQEKVEQESWEDLLLASKDQNRSYFEELQAKEWTDGLPSDFPLPDFFITGKRAYAYPVPDEGNGEVKEWRIEPDDEIYGLCFVYQARLLPFAQLKPFLQHQRSRVGDEYGSFVRGLYIAYEPLLKPLLWEYLLEEDGPAEVENVEAKKNQEEIPVNKTDPFNRLSRKQWVMLFYFAFKSQGIDPSYGEHLPFLARLLHAIHGSKVGTLNNSEYYKFFRDAPILNKDKQLIVDLKKVKSTLESVGLKEAAQEVNIYLKESVNELREKENL